MSQILTHALEFILALLRPEPARELIPVRIDRRHDPRRRR